MGRRIDYNNDRRIERKELKRWTSRHDYNQDGKVDDREKRRWMKTFDKLDKNNDGRIGPRERRAAFRKMLHRINSGKKLTPMEKKWMQRWDTNQDGKIDRTELLQFRDFIKNRRNQGKTQPVEEPAPVPEDNTQTTEEGASEESSTN